MSTHTTSKLKDRAKTWIKDPSALATMTMLIVWLLSLIFIKGFSSFDHNVTMLRTASFLGLIVVGQAVVILTGGMDMSVSSVVTLSSVVASASIQHGANTIEAILLALAASLLVGAINATGIQYLRISPIIMTMAMVSIIEGILLVFTQGTPPSGCTEAIKYMASGTPCVFANAFWIWLLFLAVMIWLTTYTKFGRNIYAIGANVNAARLSGISPAKINYLVYLISAFCSGVAGILLLGNIGNTYLTLGTPYQLHSVSAVVIGGIAISGGKGKYWGIIAGTLMIIMFKDILNVLSMSAAGREVFQGALILIVLFAYGRDRKKK